jgi:hypothetical protein
MQIAASIALAFALIIWLAVVGNFFSLTSSDAAGNGLTQAFCGIGIVLLWILMAALLFMAGSTGRLPGWMKFAALLLHPASCAAAFAVLGLLSSKNASQWMIAVPIVVPAIFLGIAAWTILFKQTLPDGGQAGIAAWGVVLLLSMLPWPRVFQIPGEKRAKDAAWQAKQAQNQAAFEKLTAESPVRDWAKLTSAQNEYSGQAVEAIRAHPRKSAEIAQMLREGDDTLLPLLWNLNVEDSAAELSEPVRTVLLRKAEGFRPSANVKRYREIRVQVDQYENTLGWLAEHPDWEMRDVLDAFESMIRAFPDGPNDGALVLARIRP